MDTSPTTSPNQARRLRRTCRTQTNLQTIGKNRQSSRDVRLNLNQIATPLKFGGPKGITSPLSNKSIADKSTKSSTTKNSTNQSSNKSTAPYSHSSSDKTTSSFGSEAGLYDINQCFLKTKTNKFKRFSIEVRDGQLNFYKFRSGNDNQ